MAEKILVQVGEGQSMPELARGLLAAVGDGDPHDVEYSPHAGGFLVPEAVAARYSLTVDAAAVVLSEPGAAAADAPAAARQRSRKAKAPRAAPAAAAAPADGTAKAPRKRASRSKAAKAAAAAVVADGDGGSDA